MTINMSAMKQVLSDPYLLGSILLYPSFNKTELFCQCYQQAWRLFNDPVFWYQKSLIQLGIPSDVFKATTLSASKRYLELSFKLETKSWIDKINQNLLEIFH